MSHIPSKLPCSTACCTSALCVAVDGSKTNTPELKQSGQPTSGTADNSLLANSSSQFLTTKVSASKNTHLRYWVRVQQWIFVNVIPSSGLLSRARFAASWLLRMSTFSMWSHTLESFSLDVKTRRKINFPVYTLHNQSHVYCISCSAVKRFSSIMNSLAIWNV